MSISLPPTLKIDALPMVYHWKGSNAKVLYWDDPSNWEEGRCPDHPEATAVFPDSNETKVEVTLRRPAVIANLWFRCKTTSYSIKAEGQPQDSVLYFSTGQQLANIVLSQHNTQNHLIAADILHSCKKLWGPGWAEQTIPASNLARTAPSQPSASRIVFSGSIGSYKEAPRASLNLDGYIDVELSGRNTFIGPIDVRRGNLIVTDSDAVPSGVKLSLYDPGRLELRGGAVARVSEFLINGQKVPAGAYFPADMGSAARAKTVAQAVSKRMPQTLLPGLVGEGAILVTH